MIENSAKAILAQVPAAVKMGPVMAKYPVLYEQSMNTVLVQEVIRFEDIYIYTYFFVYLIYFLFASLDDKHITSLFFFYLHIK